MLSDSVHRSEENAVTKRSSESPVELVSRVKDAVLEALPGGAPAQIVAAFNEFCARVEEPLSPHLFFQLVEQAPTALSITDAHATILYANRMFEQLTGYAREEVIGKNESILSNQATPSSVYEELWATLGAQRTWTGKLVNRTRDGAAYLAEISIAPVLDSAGRITHFLGMHRDITRIYELQSQVEHQKGLLETILDAAPVLVALLDQRGRVLLDNQEYKKLLGDLRGTEPAEILLKAVAEQAGVVLPGPGGGGTEFRNVEVRLEFSSRGPRWFDCSLICLDEPGRTASCYFKSSSRRAVCLLLASETTRQRREHERARLEHLRASVAEQQRIRGMREALAAATFQIQQPLNLINAATAMLNRNGEGSDHLLQVLEQIGASAQRAYDVLRTALPTEDEEPLRHLNLNEVVQEVLEMSTEQLLKNGITVTWRPTAVLPAFTGRSQQVRGLLMNIVENAIVALTQTASAERELEIRTAETSGVLTVTVQDNGPGIPPAERLAVFQPLYCGWKIKAGHAGMGLAMAQETAAQHGGGIEIDPQITAGCRVRIELPVKR